MIRRLLESATRTLPLIALLFVPLLFGLQAVYPWAEPGHIADRRNSAPEIGLPECSLLYR